MFGSFGVDLEEAKSRGLHALYESPVELQIDSVVSRIFRMLNEHNLRRVVIDSLGDLSVAAGDPQRLHDYMYSLTQHFVIHRTTCIITAESSPSDFNSSTGIFGLFSYMSDNVVRLEVNITDRLQRTVYVTKSRSTAHDLNVHTLQLGARGARIVWPDEPPPAP